MNVALAVPLPADGPGAIAGAVGFTVDQTIQMASDQFEIQLATSEAYLRRRNPDTLVRLASGLRLPGGGEIVDHIVGGRVDDWELHVVQNQLNGLVRGRDAMALPISIPLFVTYVAGFDVRSPAVIARERETMPAALLPIPTVPEPERLVGTWRASTIVADLARRLNLALSWEAPDYELLDNVEVAGPPLQTMWDLVAPFSQFEPSKVDIDVDGATLVVRSRPGVDAEISAPEANTFSVRDARIADFLIRSKQLDHIRTVRVIGGVSNCVNGDIRETVDVSETSTSITIGGPFASPQKIVTKRVVTTVRTRYPGPFVLSEKKETYMVEPFHWDLILVTREETFNTFDDAIVNANCRILNNPLQRKSVSTKTEFLLIETGTTRSIGEQETVRKTTHWDYEEDGTLKLQETVEETRRGTAWLPTGQEIRTYRVVAPGQYQEVVERFTRNADNSAWLSVSRQQSPASGHRPGGPGLGGPQNLVVQQHFFKAGVIDLVVGARDFSFSNDNLRQDSVDLIYDQAVAASGAWEHEINMIMVNVPWLREGQMIYITGLTAEDGSAIPLRPALLTEVNTAHTESQNPTSISQVKAVWWSAT